MGWFCKPAPLWCFSFRWRYRLSFRLYNNPHSLHGKKLSLLCFLSCLSRLSFLVKRFWHTPQVKVLRCLFRRWCSINWLFLTKVCWQYPQECICKRQMYIYNMNQTVQLHVNYLLKLHVWLTSALSNWRLLWALNTSGRRMRMFRVESAFIGDGMLLKIDRWVIEVLWHSTRSV